MDRHFKRGTLQIMPNPNFHVKEALFTSSPKTCFTLKRNSLQTVQKVFHIKGAYSASETKLYFYVKEAVFANNTKFHVKEVLFTNSAKKSFMLKGHTCHWDKILFLC